MFSKKRPRVKELPDLSKTDEEFQKEWGISKEEEERRLVQLREQVEAQHGPLRPSMDKYYLRRFLRARSQDVARAKEMLLKHLQWRKENGVDTILEDFEFEERDAFLTLYPQGYHKADKLGRPIYIQHLGQINMTALMKLTSEERMIKFHIQEYERALKYIFPACSKAAGCHISQTLTILDLKGVGLRHLTGDVKRIMSMITRVDQDNYPETLGKTLLINAPSIFKMIWGLVKPMLDPRTQEKIEVCPSNYMSVLLKWVDEENIPEYMGGKSKGSLLDDVGVWKDPKVLAEVEADILAREGSLQAEVGGEAELVAGVDGGSPLSPETSDQGAATTQLPPLEGMSSDDEEFLDVRSRRMSMHSAASTSYLSAEEEYHTPHGFDTPQSDRTQPSFTSDQPLIAGDRQGQGLSSNSYHSPGRAPPYPLVIPNGSLEGRPSSGESGDAATPALVAAAVGAAAGAPSLTTHPAPPKPQYTSQDLIPSPPLQIPILARVRALEEKIPAAERPLRRYLPPGDLPSKVVGEGTLLSRVVALEQAMDTLLRAQDSAMGDSGQRTGAAEERSMGCCGCCVM